MSKDLDPTFFATPRDFRAWLREHHGSERELMVGFWKKGTGRPSITWPESVDEALCFGWIDGVRRRIDEEAYCIRFTPRRERSTWSAVNIGRFRQLRKEGRVAAAGLEAWQRRVPERSRTYAYEQAAATGREPELGPGHLARFREHGEAWRFFGEQPPSFRRRAIHWVESAKRAETRERRLGRLIESCARGERAF